MKKFLPALVLTFVVAAVYAPAALNGFVWDDTALIQRDPLIRSWRLLPEGFQHFLFTDATASDFYRPIQRVTYTLDYAAFGLRPGPYHIVSIGWHLAAALALYFLASELLLFWRIEERVPRIVPLAAAVVWAIHPVQSSAVAYISGRADSLAAAFGFAGMFLALRGLRARNETKLWSFTLVAAPLFLLSALSKEIGLIFPALWLVLVLAGRNWRATRAAAVAILFVLVAYFSLRLSAEHFPAPPTTPVPALVRPIVVARAFAEYAGLLGWPISLHMDRSVETQPSGFNMQSANASAWRELQTLAGIVLIAAFLYWLNRERRRDRAVFLLLCLTLLAYLPVSGVFGLNATVAEHWLYLPSAFFFLALALVVMRLERLRTAVIPLIILWALFLGGRTFVRTFDWRNQRTFLERTIAQRGNSARMLINLAGLEMTEGHLDDAKRHLVEALQKSPEQPLGVINLAAVEIKKKEFAAAQQLLEGAKEMPLVEAQGYELMAIREHAETGRVNVLRMRLASRTGPPQWPIEKRYVRVLDETGATEAAITELQKCLTTQWYRADSWQLLGELLTKTGRFEEAAQAFATAQRYDTRMAASTASVSAPR